VSPDGYELHDALFLQEESFPSAANALSVGGTVVPKGRIRTILSAVLMPSANETRTVWFSILTKAGIFYPITIPIVAVMIPVTYQGLPALTDGMELKLYPGESLVVNRDVATAGSTIRISMRFIETDMPYYSYDDPQNKVVKQVQKHGSVFRSTGGISTGGAGAADRSSGRTGRESGGRPEPV
jgi:hypothetical protein